MSEAALIERVMREKQEARVEGLLAALKAIAADFDERKPDYSPDRDRNYFDNDEAWWDGHSLGVEEGKWLAGEQAQTALDDWDATA